MKTLVIVESPNKIAKISKCLGSAYRVVATVGHFRDLPRRELGVDTSSWTLDYELLEGKSRVLTKLLEEARSAGEILLGTDGDREGEAIAWHVAQVLNRSGLKRIRFQEITPAALKKAVAGAGPLDTHLVDAQQTRRVLDRLVGYQVSPLLSVFGPQHSAGRVQSAVLHLVVQREKARRGFKPRAFWTVTARYAQGFEANAAQTRENGWEPARFDTEAAATAFVAAARGAGHVVEHLETKPSIQKPKPPFTTASLQQAASAALGLRPAETMALAQSLFEKGAITYHRTDSVSLSDEAIAMAREFISRNCPAVLADAPVKYRNGEASQEAHEAIRPTAMKLEPDVQLTTQEEQLFNLVGRRFLASQCKPALFDVTVARIQAGAVRLLSRGVVERFAGHRHFLPEDESTAAARHEGTEVDTDQGALPSLKVGDALKLTEVRAKGDHTQPPPRFTQATLVRELERTGIGRPSTYAATVTLLFERRYLFEEKKAVAPTPRGWLIDGALSAAFPDVVATDNTARLEKQLDEIAAGHQNWKSTLTIWNEGFSRQLSRATAALARFTTEHPELVAEVAEAPKKTGKLCPRCQQELLLRHGSKGAFLSCSAWPVCDYRADPSARPSERLCPVCKGAMTDVDGRFGVYARCNDSACKGREDLSPPSSEPCPRCAAPLKNKGSFLGCSTYPACNFSVDAEALAHARKTGATCPHCQRLMVKRKGPKGPFLACLGFPSCRHTAEVPSRRKAAGHV